MIMANLQKLTREYGEIVWTGKKCILGLPISFTRYILTDTKLVTKIGLFSIREDEIELYRVYDMALTLPFGQRIVGCGTLKLLSKDSDTPAKELKSIKRPREAKKLIDEAVRVQRDKYYVRGRDMIGMNAPNDHDIDNDGVYDCEEE